MLTNTDLDRFVNNIMRNRPFVFIEKLRSLSSSHERGGQKQKCCL